eukprot:7379512-Prymnesium_polylepis.1
MEYRAALVPARAHGHTGLQQRRYHHCGPSSDHVDQKPLSEVFRPRVFCLFKACLSSEQRRFRGAHEHAQNLGVLRGRCHTRCHTYPGCRLCGDVKDSLVLGVCCAYRISQSPLLDCGRVLPLLGLFRFACDLLRSHGLNVLQQKLHHARLTLAASFVQRAVAPGRVARVQRRASRQKHLGHILLASVGSDL